MTAAPIATNLYTAVANVRANTSAPSLARAFVADILHSWHLTHLVDDVRTVASELVTNVVQYAIQSDVDATMRLCVCLNTSLFVGVIDPFPIADGLLVGSGNAPGAVDENGRGLLIVQSLSDRFGVQRLNPPEKLVWCEVNPLVSTSAYLAGQARHPKRCPHGRKFLSKAVPKLAGEAL